MQAPRGLLIIYSVSFQVQASQKPNLWKAVVKVGSQTPSLRNWEHCIFCLSSLHWVSVDSGRRCSHFCSQLPLNLMQSWGTCECQVLSLLRTSDLRVHAFGGSHKGWSAIRVNKFLPRRNWRLFIFYCCNEPGRQGRGSTHKPFQASGGVQSAPRYRLIKSLTLGQQLGMYAVKHLLGRNCDLGVLPHSALNPRG